MTSNPTSNATDNNSDWYHDTKARALLPHLEKIFDHASTHKCVFAISDYDENWNSLSVTVREVGFDQWLGNRKPDLEIFLLQRNATCTHRVILVEDICVEAVHHLTGIFNISPEMFESHLTGAQSYHDDKHERQYTGQDPRDWCTRPLKRDYVSAKWLRPYRLNLDFEPVTISDRLLSYGDAPRYKMQCDSWRMHINLHGNGAKWSNGKSSNLERLSTIASEEKVTLWHGNRDELNFIIILLDAGLNGAWETATEPAAAGRAPAEVRPKTSRKPTTSAGDYARNNTTPYSGPNISRQARSIRQVGRGIVTTINDPVGTADDIEGLGDTQISHNILHNSPLDVRNTDDHRLSDISEEDFSEEAGRQQPAKGHVSYEQPSALLSGNSPPQVLLSEKSPINSPRATVLNGMQAPLGRSSVMKNLSVRTPCSHLMVNEAFHAGLLQNSTSTMEDLFQWQQTRSWADVNTQTILNPIYAIQEIVWRDVDDFLRVIHNYLDEIEGLANDELRLEQNILTWRQTLHYLRKELRNLHSSLQDLHDYLLENRHGGKAPEASQWASKVSPSVLKTILSTEDRLHMTFGILTSSISVAEARRGISETESVNRLTELAFVYVPLSFAASFFGMQVKELNPETTSIGGFFALALVVTMSSYGLRLLTRSEFFVSKKSHFINRVRNEFSLRENAPVRTRQVARFIGRRVRILVLVEPYWPSMVVVLILIPLAAMIVVWANQSLAGGIKVALAVIYIIMGVLLIGFVLSFVLPLSYMPSYHRRQAI